MYFANGESDRKEWTVCELRYLLDLYDELRELQTE